MKNKFILGFITGGIICATATGFAVEYVVTANPFPVAVNGTETAIEGYNINDNTYFKLRDVADAVGGFNVGFSDNTITIDTDTAAEPTPTPTAKPIVSNISAVWILLPAIVWENPCRIIPIRLLCPQTERPTVCKICLKISALGRSMAS